MKGKAVVELRETFTENVVSGVGVVKKPFAVFKVDAVAPVAKKAKRKEPGQKYVYSVSVATWTADNDDDYRLAVCGEVFTDEEEMFKWLAGDWNFYAAEYGGRKFGRATRKNVVEQLDRYGFADLDSDLEVWNKYKIVRKEI